MKIDLTQKEKDFLIHMSRVMGDMYDEEKMIYWMLKKKVDDLLKEKKGK